MAIAGLILDILLIGLLAATVFFVLRLHNRLEVIRGANGDLESLLRNLITSTSNAERSLATMRQSASDLNETLGKQVRGAHNASEELQYLLASADSKAKQLLTVVESARVPAANSSAAPAMAEGTAAASAISTATGAAASVAANPAGAPVVEKRQQAEHDLLKAIEKLR